MAGRVQLAFSPSGKTLLAAVDDTLHVWDAADAQKRATVRHPQRIAVARYAGPDVILTVAGVGSATTWDVDGNALAGLVLPAGKLAWPVASADGKEISAVEKATDPQPENEPAYELGGNAAALWADVVWRGDTDLAPRQPPAPRGRLPAQGADRRRRSLCGRGSPPSPSRGRRPG